MQNRIKINLVRELREPSKMMMKAILACGNYWNSPFHVGSHEIARALLERGWQVAFVSNPISPLHIFTGLSDQLSARFKNYRLGGEKKKNLFAYVPGGIFTPARRPLLDSTRLLKNWYKLAIPNLVMKLKTAGFDNVDFIYLDSLYFTFLPSVIKHTKTIVRIADRLDEYPNYSMAMDNLIKEFIPKVDLVAYTAKTLRGYVTSMNPQKTLYLPNGVNFNHFDINDAVLPAEFDAIPRPRVIYIGAIERWFDHEAVKFWAGSFPNVSFVLIGNDENIPQKVKNIPNVYILGKKSYETIPNYLYYSDVGIIPFDLKNNKTLVDGINPLKMYEYMAAGLPVVSASWKELENINPPAYLYKNYRDGSKVLSHALLEGKSRRQEYKDYARTKNWSNKVDDMLNALGF